MFENRIKIFKIFDFQVHLDFSWLFIVLLVTWSLAFGYFPSRYSGLSSAAYLIMGICGALGLFFSIVFHELCHSLVARRFGLAIRGITLFVFGGVAEMEEEPPSAKAEFIMAIAGPISSIVLGIIFFLLTLVTKQYLLPYSVTGVFDYLRWINFVLAAFNLVPAFPLDGGRVLRSSIWYWKKDLRLATRISSRLGAMFGIFLSLTGIFYFFGGAFIIGLWYFLIGMFLQGAANMSYQRMLIMRALEGETTGHFMKPNPISVPSGITLQSLVQDYIYKYHYKFFPVADEGDLRGCISTQEVKAVAQEKWAEYKVSKVLVPCDAHNRVSANTPAIKTLSIMNRTGKSRMMVVEGNRLVGVVTLKDLLKFISLKMDLEGEK